MSQVRLNFLNWQPDLEDTEHDGLTVADNVVHEPEGFKPVHLASGGSFATTGGLGATTATVISIVARPVGPANDVFCAWLSGEPATLHAGINGVTAAALTSAGGSTTGYPLSFSTTGTSGEIVAFDVTEYAGKIFWVVQAQQSQAAPSITATLTHAGYMDY